MTAAYPSTSNTYVPSLDDSGKLFVDFSRNPSDFPINRYLQIVPVKHMVGYYGKMTIEEAGRILNTDLSDFLWNDSNDSPSGTQGAESHNFLSYGCARYAYTAQLGDLAINQAAWDVVSAHTRIKAQQAMTARAVKVLGKLSTSGNWAATNTATATAAGGGLWSAATTANLYIRKGLDYAINTILQQTLANVRPEDLLLVVNPNLAHNIAESQEFIDYVKGSPMALAQIRGELPGRNQLFGLPDMLYGLQTVVEDTVYVSSRKGATRATSYALPDATPLVMSRPGGLVGVAGAPSFSTATLFVYEPDEMKVETMHDTNNRRVLVRVTDNFDAQITADISGFLFTGAM